MHTTGSVIAIKFFVCDSYQKDGCSHTDFKMVDAKSTPSYFIGPTFICIIMQLSDLSSKIHDLPHWGRTKKV